MTPVEEKKATATNRAATEALCTHRSTCRLCGGRRLAKVWSFGKTPLANAYVDPARTDAPEPFFPLDVFRCEDCRLVQLICVVDPALLFAHYQYVSSTSAVFRAHFEAYAAHIIERFRLTGASFVVDVGSNDGVLLKPFRKHGIRTLGIDPAENIARIARADGIETEVAFFTPEIAKRIARARGRADIITANNVFAHTDDVTGFVAAVQELLASGGVFVFEVQYLGDLLEKNLFDIVYHEHLCYYHVHPLVTFFARHGFDVFDVGRVETHGGSIRVFVQRKNGPHARARGLDDLLAHEEECGLNRIGTYRRFAERIRSNKAKLHAIIREIKGKGGRIAGYGAPAKLTTFLYAFGLDGKSLDYIVDDDRIMKQGKLTPGTRIPIVDPGKLYEDKPAFCLILAWNFAEQIMNAHKRFTEQGGKFIVPVPFPIIR